MRRVSFIFHRVSIFFFWDFVDRDANETVEKVLKWHIGPPRSKISLSFYRAVNTKKVQKKKTSSVQKKLDTILELCE